MDLQKLIDKGEIVKLPVVDACLLQRKTVKVKDKEVAMEQGPCTRIEDGFCAAYIDPNSRWRLGNCGLATHLIQEEDEKKFKLNPIKASKRR